MMDPGPVMVVVGTDPVLQPGGDVSPRNYRYAKKGKKSSGNGKGGGGKTARESSSKK